MASKRQANSTETHDRCLLRCLAQTWKHERKYDKATRLIGTGRGLKRISAETWQSVKEMSMTLAQTEERVNLVSSSSNQRVSKYGSSFSQTPWTNKAKA